MNHSLEINLFLCLLTSEWGPFRALKMRPVRQEAIHSLWSRLFCGPLNASRTREGCSAHRISLPYRRSLFFTPNASENASRTPGGLFEHGTHIPYHRWPSPVPNARQRQVAAAAEPGVHFSRPLAGSWLRGYQSCKLPPEIVAYISKYK